MNRMRRKILRIISLIVAVLVVLTAMAMGVVTVQARQFRESGLIARNVNVAGMPMGDLSRETALQKLQEQWLPTLPEEIKVTHEGETIELGAEELGREPQLEAAVDKALRIGRSGNVFEQLSTRLQLMKGSVEVPVTIEVEAAKLDSQVRKLAAKLDHEPVNARVTVTGAETVEVIPGKPGLKLDQKAATAALSKALTESSEEPVALASRKHDPAITAKDLAHLEVVLGSYSTPYSAGKVDRSHNLKLATAAVNGTVVMPGAVFSTDRTIGPRIAERGFREAPIFADGEVTPATGGGICQVATTIYNAALFANLPIVQRHKHSQPVTYAPAGRDATVYSGQADLRFRNDTGYPVVLLASMSGSRVQVRILGKKEAQAKVRLERSGVTSVPFEKQEIPDPTLELGKKKVEKKGRNGIRATVYQVVTKTDGTQERRLLHTDVYKAQKEVVRVGTKKPVVPPGMKLTPDGKLVPLKPGEKGPDGKIMPLKPGQTPPAAGAGKTAPTAGTGTKAAPKASTKAPTKAPTKSGGKAPKKPS